MSAKAVMIEAVLGSYDEGNVTKLAFGQVEYPEPQKGYKVIVIDNKEVKDLSSKRAQVTFLKSGDKNCEISYYLGSLSVVRPKKGLRKKLDHPPYLKLSIDDQHYGRHICADKVPVSTYDQFYDLGNDLLGVSPIEVIYVPEDVTVEYSIVEVSKGSPKVFE